MEDLDNSDDTFNAFSSSHHLILQNRVRGDGVVVGLVPLLRRRYCGLGSKFGGKVVLEECDFLLRDGGKCLDVSI